MYTQTNTKKQFMVLTYLFPLSTEALSHVVNPKLHNLTLFPSAMILSDYIDR